MFKRTSHSALLGRLSEPRPDPESYRSANVSPFLYIHPASAKRRAGDTDWSQKSTCFSRSKQTEKCMPSLLGEFKFRKESTLLTFARMPRAEAREWMAW